MQRTRTILLHLAILISGIILFFTHDAKAQQLQTTTSTQPEQDTVNENWNSHIDNQAYLQNMKNRNLNSSDHNAPVIIINRQGESRSRRDRDCIYWGCDSWGVDYRTPTTSFTYREGYRPNRYYPIRIRPKTNPHHKYSHPRIQHHTEP